jgi:hypothetical protein
MSTSLESLKKVTKKILRLQPILLKKLLRILFLNLQIPTLAFRK